MTTITAIHKTVGTSRKPTGILAADTFSHAPGVGYTVTKIARVGRTLVGCAGTSDLCHKFLAWRAGAAQPRLTKGEQLEAIVMDATGIYLFVNSLIPDRLRADHKGVTFHAIGSGRQYAIGALANGASAKRAVEIACVFDPFSKPPIEELHLGS